MRTFIAFAGLSAAMILAGAACAEDIRIPVLGKAPSALHADIVRAAGQVCAEAAFDLSRPSSEDACVADSVVRAETEAKSILKHHSYASANVR